MTTAFVNDDAVDGTPTVAQRDAQRLIHSSGYQELKHVLHRRLLDRVNSEALSTLATERVRLEIRSAVAQLVEEQKTPLTLFEKDKIIEEVLHEVFGLGPLEPL